MNPKMKWNAWSGMIRRFLLQWIILSYSKNPQGKHHLMNVKQIIIFMNKWMNYELFSPQKQIIQYSGWTLREQHEWISMKLQWLEWMEWVDKIIWLSS
jgi:hypothetical protein